MNVAKANPLVGTPNSVVAPHIEEGARAFLEDLVALEDYCYLVGMSEEYHCHYPETLDALRNVKHSLGERTPKGLLPTGRLDTARLMSAYVVNPESWRQHLDVATDHMLRSTQHLLLPFAAKGMVEHAIDQAFGNLVQQKTNTDPVWLATTVQSSSGVFEKMVMQQAFYETPILPLQKRETLMLCAGLYQLLRRQPSPLASDTHLEDELIRLHDALGFHAERHLPLVADKREGRAGAEQDPIPVVGDTTLTISQQLEAIARCVSPTVLDEHVSNLASIARSLLAIPASTDAITGLQQALAYRVTHCLSGPENAPIHSGMSQQSIAKLQTAFTHHAR